MQIQLSNLCLKHLIEENQILVNGFINKIQTTEDNLLKMKIHTKKGDKNILITNNCFFVSEKSEPAKQNPGGFSAFLKKKLYNQRIISITQKELDRIVIFEFEKYYLILEFFAKGNIILCDKELNIIKAMRKEKWKDRELAKEKKYFFPTSKGKNPLKINEKEFYNLLKENEKTLFGAIIDIINIAPKILEKVFKDLKIKIKSSKNINLKESEKILEEIKKNYLKEKEGIFIIENVIYTININEQKEEYLTINETLNKLFERKIVVKKLKNKKIKIDYEQQKELLKNKEKEYFEKANLIYLKYNELKQIFDFIKNNYEKKELQKLLNEKITNKIILKKIDLEKKKIIVEI